MEPNDANYARAQGFGEHTTQRLPLPQPDQLNAAQLAAAAAIISGPRKALFGPFVPLLQTPVVMERIGALGETLRFGGSLADRIRELVTCSVARHTGNQFEWQTHAPLALKAGVAASAIDDLLAGRRPRDLATDERCALDCADELFHHHGVSDATYAEARACFGEPGTVELTALLGYFVMVCWVMNVGRTPGPRGSAAPALRAFPG